MLGGSVLFIVLMYLVMAPIDGDFYHFARRHDGFAVIEVLQRFPMASWMYLGIEYLPLFSVYCAKVRCSKLHMFVLKDILLCSHVKMFLGQWSTQSVLC